MSPPTIKLLVTDLDNTLYDWVGFFAKAFRAMLGPARELMGVELDELLDQLQAVHRRQGDSEHPWSLAQTRSALERWPGRTLEERKAHLDPAFHAFNKVRKQHLQLYPGVARTLVELRNAGVPIVGHTEASTVNAHGRVVRLGLDSFMDSLYTAKIGEVPAHTELPVFTIPRAIHKPDPRILTDICAHYGVLPEDALYVGDSLTRDIAMAQQIGMHSAWAAYGTQHDPEDWRTLTRITHWTAEDVARVEAAREQHRDVSPETTLASFDQLLALYNFVGGEAQAQPRSA